MTNQELLTYVGKNVRITMQRSYKRYQGVLEKWVEYHGDDQYYTFNIRNVAHGIRAREIARIEVL